MADLGNVPLAANNEEYLLLELLPNVANKFLRNRREVALSKSMSSPATRSRRIR